MRGIAPAVALVLIGAVAAQLGVTAAAQSSTPSVFRWVDKDGHVHYGDTPAANAQRLNPQGVDTSGPDQSAQQAADDKQVATCKQKKETLDTYAKAATITETDALGNKHEYSVDEKTQLMSQLQQYLEQHCAAGASSGQ